MGPALRQPRCSGPGDRQVSRRLHRSISGSLDPGPSTQKRALAPLRFTSATVITVASLTCLALIALGCAGLLCLRCSIHSCALFHHFFSSCRVMAPPPFPEGKGSSILWDVHTRQELCDLCSVQRRVGFTSETHSFWPPPSSRRQPRLRPQACI